MTPDELLRFGMMSPVDHPANSVDFEFPNSQQGYQVYRDSLGRYWGCRYQWDSGSGNDHDWKNFGFKFSKIRRHK